MSVAYLGNQYITFTELGNNFVIPQHAYFPPLDIEYLIVGAGGGGGLSELTGFGDIVGGGGGGGGYVTGSYELSYGINYNVQIGTGSYSLNGQNTLFDNIIAYGGGKGGNANDTGSIGGSGGGGAQSTTATPNERNGGFALQGFPGGTGSFQNITYGGGGGGGASQSGFNSGTGPGSPTNLNGGNGGDGKQWFDGNYYAGGGAGGSSLTSTATGGIGGGGNGGADNTVPTNGTANTGGGGGGGATANLPTASMGGSGIVKLRYTGSQSLCVGGVITQSGGYIYHTFTSGSSTLVYTGIPTPVTTTTTTTPAPTTTTTTTLPALAIDYLIVGAGGEAWNGGGGGAQYVTGSVSLPSNTYAVRAAKITTGTTTNTQVSGSSSFFNLIESKGGGNGGEFNVNAALAKGWNGASGGGGAARTGGAAGGTGLAGFNGGATIGAGGGAGGGGAAGAGGTGSVGAGKQWLDGNYYCGGGRGFNMAGDPTFGASPNGGGGGNNGSGPSGPGVVIIRYTGTPVATGGTITQSGGYTYHTYTGTSTDTVSTFVY